jgi:hypothetical protein
MLIILFQQTSTDEQEDECCYNQTKCNKHSSSRIARTFTNQLVILRMNLPSVKCRHLLVSNELFHVVIADVLSLN